MRSASLGSKPSLKRHVGLDHLAGGWFGNADHARLSDGLVLHQCALDLERPDQMAGALDDVIGAADEPIIALAVAHREVAGEIPAADEALLVSLPLR